MGSLSLARTCPRAVRPRRVRLNYAAFLACLVFAAYLALEPLARRHWPRTLISWTRLLEGRLRDPAVGREVLLGTSAGLGLYGAWVLIAIGLRLAGVESEDRRDCRSLTVIGTLAVLAIWSYRAAVAGRSPFEPAAKV